MVYDAMKVMKEDLFWRLVEIGNSIAQATRHTWNNCRSQEEFT